MSWLCEAKGINMAVLSYAPQVVEDAMDCTSLAKEQYVEVGRVWQFTLKQDYRPLFLPLIYHSLFFSYPVGI